MPLFSARPSPCWSEVLAWRREAFLWDAQASRFYCHHRFSGLLGHLSLHKAHRAGLLWKAHSREPFSLLCVVKMEPVMPWGVCWASIMTQLQSSLFAPLATLDSVLSQLQLHQSHGTAVTALRFSRSSDVGLDLIWFLIKTLVMSMEFLKAEVKSSL